MIRLALLSLWNRKASALLTICAIAVSVMMLLGVEQIRQQTRSNFANTISGTDLIVGARTGSTQLLLASVFNIGQLSNTMSWQSYRYLTELPQVAWHVPLALGDSLRGFPVVGTTAEFFTYFNYGQRQALEFANGQPFNSLTDLVVGAEVAQSLQLTVGSTATLAHGSGGLSFSEHDEHDFSVTGVLKRTGTPVDHSVYVDLGGLSLVHDELPQAQTTEH